MLNTPSRSREIESNLYGYVQFRSILLNEYVYIIVLLLINEMHYMYLIAVCEKGCKI